jgi:DNA-binding SARP family transcriptional activator
MIAAMGSTARAGTGPGGAVRLRVLGPFAVEVGGEPSTLPPTAGRKARTLLKLLAVEPGRLVPADRALEVLWPDGRPARPAENLAVLVSRLRSWLGSSAVEGGREGYRLGGGVEVEIAQTETQYERGQSSHASGHPGVARGAAQQDIAHH